MFEPSAVTKFQGEPCQRGVKYTGVGEFCEYRILSRKRYQIGHGTLTGSHIGSRPICAGSNDLEPSLTEVRDAKDLRN